MSIKCGSDEIVLTAPRNPIAARSDIAECVRSIVMQSVQQWMKAYGEGQAQFPDPDRRIEDALSGAVQAIWKHGGWVNVAELLTVDSFGLESYRVEDSDSGDINFEFCPTFTARVAPAKTKRMMQPETK